MDYFSTSMITTAPVEIKSKPLINDHQAVSLDRHNLRRTSRSKVRNTDAWVRKRALMQRGYQWTTTCEGGESMMNSEQNSDNRTLNDTTSLPNSSVNSLAYTDQSNSPSSSTAMISNANFELSDQNNFLRRRSARRLPEIPSLLARSSQSNHRTSFTDEVILPTSSIDYPCHPIRENSLGNRSKSIDSDCSVKIRSSHPKLLHTHQFPNAKSVDLSNLVRHKSSLVVVNNTLLPQRSLDYPCIVRKGPDLSDIVRRRMLYSKISKQQGDSFSASLERDHIPKVPRKIIIRQDNSIEIALR